MQDRYLFRGKRLDNGEWVIGLLTIMWGQLHIINPNDENTAYPINPTTISQCTGLHASKSYRGESEADRLISEGDVVRGRNEYEISDVVCRDGVWIMSMFLGHSPALWEMPELEIIGTIHDGTEGEG